MGIFEAMKQKAFQELLRSIREGGAILRGEVKASRRIVLPSPKARKIPDQPGGSPRR
jgi:hypothetical protein